MVFFFQVASPGEINDKPIIFKLLSVCLVSRGSSVLQMFVSHGPVSLSINILAGVRIHSEVGQLQFQIKTASETGTVDCEFLAVLRVDNTYFLQFLKEDNRLQSNLDAERHVLE